MLGSSNSKHVTIFDIADKLGISASTVSRALKDHPDIKESTKVEVKKMAKSMNYEPNVIASGLRMSVSKTIGIIVPKIANFFYSSAIEGIEELAYDLGYRVVISQNQESYEREVENAKAMFLGRVDGVLASISKQTESLNHFVDLQSKNIPIVFFNRIPKDIEASKVFSDDYKGAILATSHLVRTGCKQLCHLQGPKQLSLAQNRRNGFVNAVENYQMKVDHDLIIETGQEIDDGYRIMKKILNTSKKPDGILAFNDRVAIGAMKAAKEKDIKIPEDISVIGFSNAPEAQIIEPALTTVEQSGKEVGKRAFKMLLDRIKDKSLPPENLIVDTKLILRSSTRN